MAIKKDIYIIILASFLLSLFLTLFFVCPLLKEIKQSSKTIISQKNSVFALKNKYDYAADFLSKSETYESNLEKMDRMFIDSQNPVVFIEFLEKTASESEVEVKISTPSFLHEGPLSYAVLQLSCFGDFPKILRFVNALEMDSYLIDVKTLNIGNYKESQEAKNTAEKIKASLLIKAFAK